MLGAEAHVRVGGEVKDKVAALHRGGQRGQVEIVAADEAEPRVGRRGRQEPLLAGGEIIPADHGQAVREQAVGQVGADEAGRTGDEDALHESG